MFGLVFFDDTHVCVSACSPGSPLSHLAGFVAAMECTFRIPIRQACPKSSLSI